MLTQEVKKKLGAPRKNKGPEMGISAKASAEERAFIQRAADKDGRSLSNFMLMAGMERAHKILEAK